MEGFSGANPILVKVTWADAEVALTNPAQTPEGLRADVKGADGIITRWFAPWGSVTYIRQQLSAEESGVGTLDPPKKPDKEEKIEEPSGKLDRRTI